MDAKWAEKSEDGNYILTEKGEIIIETFYLEGNKDGDPKKKR
jgi:predicted transcriptional regulator